MPSVADIALKGHYKIAQGLPLWKGDYFDCPCKGLIIITLRELSFNYKPLTGAISLVTPYVGASPYADL